MSPKASPLSKAVRRELSHQALRVATDLREDLEIDDLCPACPFDAALWLGISVRFTEINMEGVYLRTPRPTIIVSSKRPFGRRLFNAAHELGHHKFGHGSRLDELQERGMRNSWEDPDEFLADTFAGFFLMPLLAMESAFSRRGWTPSSASPLQIYSIASDFGVGYTTLITHLCQGLSLISEQRAESLKKSSTLGLRRQLIGDDAEAPLRIASPKRASPDIDIETGTLLALPKGAMADTDYLTPVAEKPNASVFMGTSPGKAVVRFQSWKATVRIQRKEFVGLAKFRHLEAA